MLEFLTYFWSVFRLLHFLLIGCFCCLVGKSLQESPVNARVSQSSILGPSLILLCNDDLCECVIGNLVINADDTNLYSKWDQASVVWQQFELTSGLKSNLSSTVVEVGWGRLVVLKWLFTKEIQLVSVGCSSKSGVDVKMNGCLTLKVLFKKLKVFFFY